MTIEVEEELAPSLSRLLAHLPRDVAVRGFYRGEDEGSASRLLVRLRHDLVCGVSQRRRDLHLFGFRCLFAQDNEGGAVVKVACN